MNFVVSLVHILLLAVLRLSSVKVSVLHKHSPIIVAIDCSGGAHVSLLLTSACFRDGSSSSQHPSNVSCLSLSIFIFLSKGFVSRFPGMLLASASTSGEMVMK